MVLENSATELARWLPGYIIDRKYRIVRQITVTDRCETYLAEELHFPREKVAIKRLRPDKMQDPDALKRFEREGAILRWLRYNFIIALHDNEVVGDNRYMVMEFANKGSLKDYLDTQPNRKLRPIEALAIATSVCQGLAVTHRRNIVHRDVKPGNILLFAHSETIVAKLADFSIARVPADLSDDFLTEVSGITPCTPLYASPEQLRAEVADIQSDLYSWAIVFFEMLTGESPVPSLKDPLTYTPQFNEFALSFFSAREIPNELGEVLQKALRTDRELRYRSAEEVLKILESIKSRITATDVASHLSMGVSYAMDKQWQSAKSEFEAGLNLCNWYGESD